MGADLATAPLFRPIDVAPAYQKVADAIEREIVNGRINPGDPIGTEHELVRQFGVNRSTIREGIRVLEEGGLTARLQPAPERLSSALQQARQPPEPRARPARYLPRALRGLDDARGGEH